MQSSALLATITQSAIIAQLRTSIEGHPVIQVARLHKAIIAQQGKAVLVGAAVADAGLRARGDVLQAEEGRQAGLVCCGANAWQHAGCIAAIADNGNAALSRYVVPHSNCQQAAPDCPLHLQGLQLEGVRLGNKVVAGAGR